MLSSSSVQMQTKSTTNCPASTSTSSPPLPPDATAQDDQTERQVPSTALSPSSGGKGSRSVKEEPGSSTGVGAESDLPPSVLPVTSSTECSSIETPVLAIKSKAVPYQTTSSPQTDSTDFSSTNVLNGPSRSKHGPQINHVINSSSNVLAPIKVENSSDEVSTTAVSDPRKIDNTNCAGAGDDIMTVSKSSSSASATVVNGQPSSSASPPLPSPNPSVTSSMLQSSNASVKVGLLMNNNTLSDTVHTIKTENEEMVNNSPTFVPTSTAVSTTVNTGSAHEPSSSPAPVTMNGTINSSSSGALNQPVLFNKGIASGGVITSGPSNYNNNSLSNSNIPSVGSNNPALTGATVVQQHMNSTPINSSGTVISSPTMAPTTTSLNFKPAPSGNITIGGSPGGNFVGTSGGITIGGGGTTPNAASQLTPTYIQTPTGLLLSRPPTVNAAGGGNLSAAPTTPVIAHKSVVPRMVINPQAVGARPGVPGSPVTLQAFSGLPPGAQGQHLLVRTQSGEYQLLRVGMPAPTPTTASGTPSPLTSSSSSPSSTSVVTSALAQLATIHQQQQQTPSSPSLSVSNSPSVPQPPMMSTPPGGVVRTVSATVPSSPLTPRIATAISSGSLRTPGVVMSSSSSSISNTSTPSPSPALATSTTSYRLQSVPAVPNAASNSQSGVGMTASMSMQPSMHPSSHPQVPFSNANASSVNSAATASTVSQMTPDTAKTKCKNFLTFLLELSAKQNQTVAKNVKILIQGLIDGKVSAEEFSERLQREVNSQPQPCLVGFLKKSLPPLRHSLTTKELVIDGIRPPLAPGPPTIPLPSTPVTALVPQAQQRPPVPTTPVRIVTPINSTPPVISIPPSVTSTSGPAPTARSATTPQQRLPTPSKAASAKAAKAAGSISSASSPASGKGSGPSTPKGGKEKGDKKFASSAAYGGDDDINDVAAMGGVNLAEESQKILGSTEMIGTQIRSCRDEAFFQTVPLLAKIKAKAAEYGLEEPSSDVVAMISHATEERIKSIITRLSVIAEHRMDVMKMEDKYEVTQDVKGQLRFLEDLEKLERKRHDEQEREMLIKAAKSRSKSEDPEQAKLKAKAKEMQRVAMEELRQKEANLTALQAIGPRKKPKLDNVTPGIPSTPFQTPSTSFGASSTLNRPQIQLKPRMKRVNLKDLLFLFEQEKDTARSHFLYKQLALR